MPKRPHDLTGHCVQADKLVVGDLTIEATEAGTFITFVDDEGDEEHVPISCLGKLIAGKGQHKKPACDRPE
jgi:hypothetical protein